MKAGTTLLMGALQMGQTGFVLMIDIAHSAQEATCPQSKKMTEKEYTKDRLTFAFFNSIIRAATIRRFQVEQILLLDR